MLNGTPNLLRTPCDGVQDLEPQNYWSIRQMIHLTIRKLSEPSKPTSSAICCLTDRYTMKKELLLLAKTKLQEMNL